MRERRREVQEVGWLVEVKYNSRRILALSALGQGHGRAGQWTIPKRSRKQPDSDGNATKRTYWCGLMLDRGCCRLRGGLRGRCE